MTCDEIVNAVHEIVFGAPDNESVDKLMERLEDALPHSGICDLIFQDMRKLPPEQVVEEALRQEEIYARGETERGQCRDKRCVLPSRGSARGMTASSQIDWIGTALARAGFAVPSSLVAMIERGHQDQAPVYLLREDQSGDDSRHIREHFSAFRVIPIARRGDYDGMAQSIMGAGEHDA